jgi:hypothetical protein
MSNRKGHETGNRNVFKDIGVPNAEEHLVKAQLVFKIATIMKDRGLNRSRPPICSECASPMYRRCCAASSGSFPLSAFCASLWRSIRMLRSW